MQKSEHKEARISKHKNRNGPGSRQARYNIKIDVLNTFYKRGVLKSGN